MKREDSHLSDQRLLLDLEGELSNHDEKLIRAHLDVCWKCRTRRQELENAIAAFVRAHEQEFDAKFPPAAGPRAMLKARLGQLPAASQRSSRFVLPRRLAWPLAAAACGATILSWFLAGSNAGHQSLLRPDAVIVSIPDSRLTPGAALLTTRQAVCAQTNTNNKTVSIALREKVFEEYRIVRAEPRAYELDYLVTPALGGADDIRNLWPQPYSATVWNAHVKDALEDRLREMVCDGTLDLTEAQKEIATDWIGAYKKYFRTNQPLAEHRLRNIQ